MSYFKKKDKYKKDYGMTVTVRQVKDKDGNITSDVNGAIRVLKKKLMKEGFFQELRRRESFMSKGEKERIAPFTSGLPSLPFRTVTCI